MTIPQFGWCGPPHQAPLMQQAGLDYIETRLVPLHIEDDDSFARAISLIEALPPPALAFSYLFPHDFRLVRSDKDEARNRAYFDRVVQLLALAKARIVVLGSGRTRNVPDGWSTRDVEEDFASTLDWCADALSGATLVIEPLNRNESTLVNRVADAARLVRMVNRPEVRALADFYHMDEEAEPPSELREHGAWLSHVHLADTGRLNPGTGAYDYPAFFGHLKAAGYRSLLSSECGFDGDPAASMRQSAAFLRRAWADA